MAHGSHIGRAAPRALLAVGALVAAGATLAVLRGCNEPASGDVAVVTIAGKTFHLEIVADEQTRLKGLSGRTFIEDNGGMLFVFARPAQMYFVMRDCPIPIDILFIDPAGHVIAAHAMQPEPPRTEEEKKLTPGHPGAPEWTWSNEAYEKRLTRYPSKFDAQFAIELKGGTITGLGVKEGDKVTISDADALKRRAK
jgi:uncharacterized protein